MTTPEAAEPAEAQPALPEPAPSPPRRRIFRRFGCGLGLVLWIVLLFVPCALFTLAIQQEIVISQGSAPDQQIRIWLIMDADQRGLGVSSTSVQQSAEHALCVQTDTRFLLWQGQEDPLTYCQCYARETGEAAWAYQGTHADACTPASGG
ncbi:MAG: hypothetical protein GYB67_07630 [Chloroflexi bacterium]|nr:hypothetical protein [Chloroflexota bacterium]